MTLSCGDSQQNIPVHALFIPELCFFKHGPPCLKCFSDPAHDKFAILSIDAVMLFGYWTYSTSAQLQDCSLFSKRSITEAFGIF